jgi:glucose-1-phosphate adenylyltransferase
MESHRRQVADVTVAVTPVTADQAHAFGILKVNKQGRIVHFDEKPPRERLDGLVSEVPGIGRRSSPPWASTCSARDLLVRTVSDPKLVDFGRHIIPKLVPEARVHAYVYRGYWEDVGTIQSYYDANLALCQPVPPFDFYDAARPVYSNPRFLPATKIEGSTVENALVAEGSASCRPRSGTRSSASEPASAAGCASRTAWSWARTTTRRRRGAASGRRRGLPPIGIGDDTSCARDHRQERAHRRGVRIVNEAGVQEKDGPGYFIREGIVIVPKGAAIPAGTVV